MLVVTCPECGARAKIAAGKASRCPKCKEPLRGASRIATRPAAAAGGMPSLNAPPVRVASSARFPWLLVLLIAVPCLLAAVVVLAFLIGYWMAPHSAAGPSPTPPASTPPAIPTGAPPTELGPAPGTPSAASPEFDASRGTFVYREVDLTFQASIGPVRAQSLFGEQYTTAESYLRVAVRVHNRGTDRKIDYKHLAGDLLPGVSLADDKGNNYKVVNLGDQIEGVAADGSIYPDKFMDDMVTFELPVPAAQKLTLSIQPDRFGYKGGPLDADRIRVGIPMTMVRR